MPTLETRLMTPADVPAIYEIECASFAVPWSLASLEREVSENACARYVVLAEDDVPVAYAGVWFVLDEGHIMNIAVKPDRRGLGYGERVTRAMLQLAADSGMRYMTLEVRRSNAAALGLYHKLGFIDVGIRKRYYEDNHEDALILCLTNLPESDPERDPMLIRETP